MLLRRGALGGECRTDAGFEQLLKGPVGSPALESAATAASTARHPGPWMRIHLAHDSTAPP
uniref:Uncharacterized protein n=3 Tax=unclassified Streptomyces TaxID=2593676 RepID=V9ZA20_9ACTN|nr:hypothetical protein pFRL3_259 [Streptomyces sp. FR1]AHE39551.1 hypothetical protein pFRL4_318c [Streptomyces sp. F2]AHE40276.1 hypothetical protein pFRL6_189 [Streptomyces sp. F12]